MWDRLVIRGILAFSWRRHRPGDGAAHRAGPHSPPQVSGSSRCHQPHDDETVHERDGVKSSKLRQFLRPDPMCDAPAGSTVLESTTASRFSQMEHRADQSLEAGSPELGLLLFAVIAVLIYFVY